MRLRLSARWLWVGLFLIPSVAFAALSWRQDGYLKNGQLDYDGFKRDCEQTNQGRYGSDTAIGLVFCTVADQNWVLGDDGKVLLQSVTTKQPAKTQSLGDFGIPQALETLAGRGEKGKQILAQKTPGDIGILFRERIALIINFMLGLVGAIAVLMGIISGYMYLTAFGNEEKAAGAKKTIFYAAIGLALAFGVWTILQLFGEFVGSAGKTIPDVRRPPTAEHGIEEQL